MGDRHSDKKTGNRFQIVFYVVLILFVLCIYWIDRSSQDKSSSAKATSTPVIQTTTRASSPTPPPFFSIGGLCSDLKKDGFVIVSCEDDIVLLRDAKTGYRIRLIAKENENKIDSLRFSVPFSLSNTDSGSFRSFAESQEESIHEEETDLLFRLLSGIIGSADPFIGGNAVPMLSEWSANIMKTRETGKIYHGKVKGLELSASYTYDNGGALHIVLDLV